MTLDLKYEFTNNSLSSIGSNRVRFGDVALTQAAEVGQPAISQLTFDDPAGELTLTGWRQFWAADTSAASNSQLIGKFRIGARSYTRGPSMRTTVARRMRVDLLDYNAQLGLRLFTEASAKRPAETANDRLTWVTGTRHLRLYPHPTLCAAPTTAMDAADYRKQRYVDVLADIANATGYNFWCAYDEGRQRSEVFFMSPNSSAYASTISVSNVLADVDSVSVFAPSEDAELRRDPSRITAGALVDYANGWVYENRDSTADAFEYVDQTAPLANVKSATKARAIAIRYLNDNDEEDDRLTFSIILPAAQVNAVRQGHLLPVKFSHFPGYETYRNTRVLRRTVIQEEAIGQDSYRIALEVTPVDSSAYTCSTAIAAATTDTASGPESGGATASVASTITADGTVLAVLCADNGNTPHATNMGNPAGYTVINNQPDIGRMTWSISTKAVTAGTATASATFTRGFSNSGQWVGLQAWLPWTNITKVQDTDPMSSGSGPVTFTNTPTPGNTILLFAFTDSTTVSSVPGSSGGPVTGWTKLMSKIAGVASGDGVANVTVWARCVQAGDGKIYDYLGGTGLMSPKSYVVEVATS